MALCEQNIRAPYFRHVKTGNCYAVLGFTVLESNPRVTMVTYQSQDDGLIWTRPASEFFDGRFIPEVEEASSHV